MTKLSYKRLQRVTILLGGFKFLYYYSLRLDMHSVVVVGEPTVLNGELLERRCDLLNFED